MKPPEGVAALVALLAVTATAAAGARQDPEDARPPEPPRQVVTERNPVATDTTFLYRFRKTPSVLELSGGASAETATLITTALPPDHPEHARIDALAAGEVVELIRAPVIKLVTTAPLRFTAADGAAATLPVGNVAEGYPGSYGIWLRRAGDGWELVFNDEADAWGTQHDPAHDRLAVPAEYRRAEGGDGVLAGELAGSPSAAVLRLSWGEHEWSAPFTAPFETTRDQRTDWRHHGNDLSASRYAPLDQIDRDSVGGLTVAWRWTSPDEAIRRSVASGPQSSPVTEAELRSLRHEAIPLAIDGVLYVVTSLSQLAAIDAATGTSRWVYDPESWRAGPPTNLGFVQRGAAHWRDPASGHDRLLYATSDSWLVAVDAATGEPIGDFGEDGRVDLIAGIPLARRPEAGRGRGNYTVSSPPLVIGDVAVVGSSIADRPNTVAMPRGDVRAFDVRTGALRWTFHTIPRPGEEGAETWLDGSGEIAGNTNVWTMMSADPQLGLVYLPTSTPTSDYYGGHRRGANLFAESLVALEAETGRRVWHFQAVHHGLWDYDLPAAPNLVDLEVDRGEGGVHPVRAVAQISKQGFVYVLDRATGEPVWPIEERPVPRSQVPGEDAWPTQPFPTRPPPFERQGSSADGLIEFSPELRAEALEILQRWDHGPLYTPPTERGNLQLPGSAGGANWGGAAFDPVSRVLYVPSITVPIVATVSKGDPERTELDWVGAREFGYGLSEPLGPRGLPLFAPPYARVTAIDLDRGEILWQSPVGQGPRRRVEELTGKDPGPLGSSTGLVHALVTDALVIAAKRSGATPDDPGGLWAFDKESGDLIAFVALDSEPTGSPITYLEGGRQYVVVATTGDDGVQELIALALP